MEYDNYIDNIISADNNDNNFEKIDINLLDEYIEKLKELSLFDMIELSKKVNSDMDSLESCKKMIDGIKNYKTSLSTNQLSSNIVATNILLSKDINMDMKSFENSYSENLYVLMKIKSELQIQIKKKISETNTSKSLTKEIIKNLSNKLSILKPDRPNYEYLKKRIKKSIYIYQHREDITYLEARLANYLKSNTRNILYTLKIDLPHISKGESTKLLRDLKKYFSKDILERSIKQLNSIFENIIETYIVLIFIARITERDKQSCDDLWAKLFLINLSDIDSDIYDYENNYLKQISEKIKPKIIEFVSINNL